MSKSRLFIDLETYSAAPLSDCGGYRYAFDPSTRVLLIGYAFDDEPTRLIDMEHGEVIPQRLIEALTDPSIEKWAHNAMFERSIIASVLGVPTPPEQWRCTQVHALTLTLPPSLGPLGAELRLTDQKIDDGKRLIKKFSTP